MSVLTFSILAERICELVENLEDSKHSTICISYLM